MLEAMHESMHTSKRCFTPACQRQRNGDNYGNMQLASTKGRRELMLPKLSQPERVPILWDPTQNGMQGTELCASIAAVRECEDEVASFVVLIRIEAHASSPGF